MVTLIKSESMARFSNFLCHELFRLRFNWALILAFVAFWTYSLYPGADLYAYKMGPVYVVLLSAFLSCIPPLFLYFYYTSSDDFADEVIIRFKDIFVVSSYFVILLFFSWENLTNSLVGDQISHAYSSQVHSIKFILMLSDRISGLLNIQFVQLMHAASAFVFLGFIIFIFLLYRLDKFKITFSIGTAQFNLKFNIILLFVISLGIRLVFVYNYHGHMIHPPFRLFPLWLSSIFLYPTNLSFRIPQFLGLVLLMWSIHRFACSKLNFYQSWLLGLVAGSTPVLWHVGTIAEASIWASIGFTLILLTYENYGVVNKFNLIRWTSVISILSLMRQSVFIGLFPLLLIYLINFHYKIEEISPKKAFVILIPLLLISPFIIQSFVFGTPASYIPGEVSLITAKANAFERVITAISSGIAPKAILNSILAPGIFFLFIAFIPKRKAEILKSTVFIALFVLAFIMFYTIRPALWGAGRYQAEYVAPFAILGLYSVTVMISTIKKIGSCFVYSLLIVLFLFNVYIFTNLQKYNPTAAEFVNKNIPLYDLTILSEYVYDYDKAYKKVKKIGLADSLYVAGVTYGYFGPILSGYKVEDIRKLSKLKDSEIGGSVDYLARINENIGRTKVILISDIQSSKLIENLKEAGWKNWTNFRNEKWGSVIYGLVKI